MRSLCWADHANWTKQLVLEDIDVKHLRWVSWIVADGSQIRSLSGRSAKLGDGFSRNPSDRDALLAQRTTDLQGLTGQLRGFSLEGFLSDYEEGRQAYPWTIVSDAVPDQPAAKGGPRAVASGPATVAASFGQWDPWAGVAAAEGVAVKCHVLYIGDVDTTPERERKKAALEHEWAKLFPGRVIDLRWQGGPFEEDIEDVCAHFTASKPGTPERQRILNLKRDGLTSVVAIARQVSRFCPTFLIRGWAGRPSGSRCCETRTARGSFASAQRAARGS